MNSEDYVPSIVISMEDDRTVNVSHPTDVALLSPFPSRSPTTTAFESSEDSSSLNIPPPSPTLSSRSYVHFTNSTALRDSKPESGHARRASNATFTSIPDQGSSRDVSDLRHRRTTSSNTPTFVSEISQNVNKKKAKSNLDDDLEQTMHQLDLEQDRGIDPAPFAFRPYELAYMLDPKSLDSLLRFGGTEGILAGLGTNAETGLFKAGLSVNSGAQPHHEPDSEEPDDGEREGPPKPDPDVVYASIDERRRVYGPNILPTRSSKSLLQLMWLALKDKVLVLLSIAAVISLALGLFRDFGPSRNPDDPPVDWVEGVAILVAVAIVVTVGSLNDWQKERQLKMLNDKKEERGVKVIRDGSECVIDIKEVVVGDIALLEPGEIVPCDGIFLSGHNVRCDESGATGESDAIRKVTYRECVELMKRSEDGKEAAHTDCFIVSGSKVLEGVGRYVVVAVGTKSFNGRIMMALRSDAENTPLQLKLNALAELIAKIGSAAGLILFTALMIRFFVQLGTKNPVRTPNESGIAFVNILIISVTLIVVAVPEGLPLVATLALAFATKRMTYEKLLVRVLGSCETMANTSVVCMDKTGTLTQNVMTVVAGSVGIHAKFVRQLEDNAARTNADADIPAQNRQRHSDDFSIDQARLNEVLPAGLRELFNEAIAVNSTAFEDRDAESGEAVFVGSKTETALLQFAKEMGWMNFRETRDQAEVVQMIPFSSERKAMGVVVKVQGGAGYRLYLKGASEILSKKCTRHVVVRSPGTEKSAEEGGVETKEIRPLEEENISRTIIFYANQTLRTIALCYRDFESWPPAGMQHDEGNEVPFEELATDLTLIGITGIEDPLRDDVRDAVAKCHRAGVTVKMCTGDNVLTARSMATQCGIFTTGGIIMEGPVFRKLNQAERIEIVPRLQVLARSSPEDKKVLVETLKAIGEIVGVTGDGTNDGPALKTANVGFSMGIAGTEAAKDASDIILMDDNFSSIVKAIMWGRCVNDAVRKFLQFQISTSVAAVVITLVSAVASAEGTSVLSAVQLLWINIIMDTFAALALATDPASESLLDRKPDKKTAPLFSTDMYKQILIQSIYQIAVFLVFHFFGLQILGLHLTGDVLADKHTNHIVRTLVFNAFVFAQIFNSVNCRRLDKKINIFEGIFRNRYFLAITAIEIGIQILIVFVGKDAFHVTRIGGREWGISLALGIMSIPLGALIRLLPNGPFEKLFKKLGLVTGTTTSQMAPPRLTQRPWFRCLVQIVLLGINDHYRELAVQLDKQSMLDTLSETCVEDLKPLLTLNGILLGAIGSTHLTSSVSSLSAVCLLVSAAHCGILILWLKSAKLNENWLHHLRHSDSNYYSPFGMLAMPGVWASWGGLFFLLYLILLIWSTDTAPSAALVLVSSRFLIPAMMTTVVLGVGIGSLLATAMTVRRRVFTDNDIPT